MKILSASEIRQADAYTTEHEPMASIDLMERAAAACFEWIKKRFDKFHLFKIVCGTGNNGGDGLAVARMMLESDYNVMVYVIRHSEKYSGDFKINEQRLLKINSDCLTNVYDEKDFPAIHENDVVIDAIFGTGLSKPIEGLVALFIQQINKSPAAVISIDIPSGLFADSEVDHGNTIIHSKHTLTFEAPKLTFMFSENDQYVGEWSVLDIGLDRNFIEQLPSNTFLIEEQTVKKIFKPRPKFSHKGMYGHALLIAGSHGKMGAAVLAARACLRSGIGLLTVHVPKCGYEIIQISVPEAMTETDADENVFTSKGSTENFNAVGIGCGIGTDDQTLNAFIYFLSFCKVPLVIDADAINMLGQNKDLLKCLPENSILTPHPKEFERITEKTKNDFHRHELQIIFAEKYKVFVVLKGAHTCIACPDGTVFFNNTGNPGMSKGGSGDALTGIILSFLGQGYSSKQACVLGVYLHGAAGDCAAKKMGMESILTSDLIENIGDAFKNLG